MWHPRSLVSLNRPDRGHTIALLEHAPVEQAEVERLLMKPTARRRLGKYVLLGRLGHGGMGKIYLAYHPGPAGIEKLLVIKRLHSHLTSDELLVSSFLDEARLSMALNHPNIVHTYDVGEVDGRYFMVMEHIDGQNLGVLLRTAKRSGHYPESDVWAGLFISVLEGLHAAHEAHDARGRRLNIIHRDVSPQNILITYDGTPKLVDFGIAKAAMRINETDAGVLKGKYAYMSPEQCEGHGLDARSDVFSAGIVLWEMLAGRRLYKSDSVLRSVERILHEPPISPVKVNADCDPGLARVVVKALQKKPGQRFTTAEDFRDALEDVMRRQGSTFKKANVRELMHTCFADVMTRQREVLDRCLSGDIPVDDSGDSETGRPKGKYESDSQSDLKVPEIGISVDMEPTTPSQLRVSPLVTHEGDATPPGMPTRQERKTPGTPGPLPPAVAPDAATAAYEAHELVGANKPRRRGLAAALVLFLLLALAVGLVVSGQADPLLAQLGGPKGGESGASTGQGGDAAPSDAAPTADGRAEQEDTGAAPKDDDKASAQTDGPREQPSDKDDQRSAVDDRDDAVEDTGAGDKVDAKGKRTRRERRRARRSRRDDRAVSADDAAAQQAEADRRAAAEREARAREEAERQRREEAAEKAKERTAKAATGKLTLDTTPWVTVYLNGKKLGNTPLVNVTVPSGELTLSLKNPGEGIDASYFLIVKPGKVTRKRLGLK